MLWTVGQGWPRPVQRSLFSPARVHTGHGPTMRLSAVFPLLHTAYDYDERIQ